MGIHTQTRPVIVNAIWQYIKVSERKSGQFEPTLLVHVQARFCGPGAVCSSKLSSVGRGCKLDGWSVTAHCTWAGFKLTSTWGEGFFSGYFGFLPHEGSIMATNVTANILHLREKRVYWKKVLIFTVTISDPQFTRLTRARVHQLRQILSTGEYSVHL